ncbi:MAG: hypothetical protein JJU05_09310 [Verrucomicrobia bacterium]|nr:hypothetical protein [Verrucomicrobiota bacterium]MCH8527592.1 hypothetical protein [Kiritimatiellia bacterium]
MKQNNIINTAFDFRTDTPPGKDPDTWSPTLCRYHELLWGKPLPSGEQFKLVSKASPPFYLHHNSVLGDFWLSSDTVIPTFRRQRSLSRILEQIPDEYKNFGGLGYTIGGMMLFPAIQIDRKWTINQARGCNRLIKDRFDYTVECIRRHYIKEDSPLSDVLERYESYFEIFGNFRGYIDFFHLQDIVSSDYAEVRFFTPFEGFTSTPLPNSVSMYLDYRSAAIKFLVARNQRIHDWSEIHLKANNPRH